MVGLGLLVAAVALLGAVALGTVVHELLHAAVLRAAGVDCELRWGGERDDPGGTGHLGTGQLGGALASVRLRSVPAAPLALRAASLAPLAMAVPLVAIPAGVVPDPFASGNVVVQAAVVGWLACALPSPDDFSIAFHAGALLEDGGGGRRHEREAIDPGAD